MVIGRLYFYLCATVFKALCMWHSPGLTSAGVAAAAVTLSPLAWATAVLSDPDMAVCWETYTNQKVRCDFSGEDNIHFST